MVVNCEAITPKYAAPEQFKDDKVLSTKTDIWALGGLIYRIYSGSHPF